MSVQLLPSEELEELLNRLRNCLSSLPTNIPQSNHHYNFSLYAPDPEEAEDFGVDGALNHALEVTFCPGGRKDGITFLEQGPGLTAVVDVLRKYNNDYPKHAVLQKWVHDLLESAIKAGGLVSILIDYCTMQLLAYKNLITTDQPT